MKTLLFHLLAGCSLLGPLAGAETTIELVPAFTTTIDGDQEFTMSWKTESGFKYRVERSDLTFEGVWQAVGDELVGTGDVLSFSEKATESRMFYRVNPVAAFPPIHKIATMGDSITAETSQLISATGTNYWPGCWPSHLRTLLGHRITYLKNPLSNRYTFAVSGARTMIFKPGGTYRTTMLAALASDADTVMMMLGVNDLVRDDGVAEETAANIIGFWDEILATGRQVIGLEILSARADHPSAGFFPARQIACNALLKAAAAERKIQFIECAQALDGDADGFSDSKYLSDNIHPNIAGGMALAEFIASSIDSRATAPPDLEIPASGAAAWVTSNAYPDGTPGSNVTAEGLTIQSSGNALFTPNLVSRTDGVPGNWQELAISGMTEEGIHKAGPTDFIQLYTANFSPNYATGDKLVMVAEIEMDDPFWLVWAEMNVSGVRSADHFHNGGIGVLTEKPKAYRGILKTEPWEYTGGSASFAMLKICGNGTLRIGRMGIFKAPQ